MDPVLRFMLGWRLPWHRPSTEEGRAVPGSWRCTGGQVTICSGKAPYQRVFTGRAVPLWQLRRMLYLAAAFPVAMAATRPEGAHGKDAQAAELLAVQNGDMASATRPIPG
jgi:hypothetical protein